MMILIGHNDVQGCTKDAKLRYNEWLKYYINVYVYAYFAFSINSINDYIIQIIPKY